jgi:hypothetical protein
MKNNYQNHNQFQMEEKMPFQGVLKGFMENIFHYYIQKQGSPTSRVKAVSRFITTTAHRTQ